MFHKVLNPAYPELNSREGVARARHGMGSLASFLIEQGGDGND